MKRKYTYTKTAALFPIASRRKLSRRPISRPLAALRAQQEQPNEPLTLDELREMDGEPVWADILFWNEPQWVLIRVRKNGIHITNSIGGGFSLSDKDLEIDKFYRRKPEQED